jgi:hypothetical protein
MINFDINVDDYWKKMNSSFYDSIQLYSMIKAINLWAKHRQHIKYSVVLMYKFSVP